MPHYPPSQWEQIITADPGHSVRYAARFEQMAARGADLHGEARTADAMVPRGSRILDAGCGPGRVGGRLAQLGHTVVGVDVDPYLIGQAATAHPDATWVVEDLVRISLPERFDLIVCAGNVMGFLHPDTRVEVLNRFRAHLAPQGRAIIGFGAGRGYRFTDFLADVARAGLATQLTFSTWDLRPFGPDSDFLVAVVG